MTPLRRHSLWTAPWYLFISWKIKRSRFLTKKYLGKFWKTSRYFNKSQTDRCDFLYFSKNQKGDISHLKQRSQNILLKPLPKYERPKMKRDARQKCSPFLFVFGCLYFIRALVEISCRQSQHFHGPRCFVCLACKI